MTFLLSRLGSTTIMASLCGLLMVASTATAAPAPWFRYQSLATGRYICSQVDPGVHYVKFSGPWSNAACRN